MGKGRKFQGSLGTSRKGKEVTNRSESQDSIETPIFETHNLFDSLPERETPVTEPAQKVDFRKDIKLALDEDLGSDNLHNSSCSDTSSASNNASITLGSNDTSLEQSEDDKTGFNEGDGGRKKDEDVNQSEATPWVNLFKDNRQPSKGLALESVRVDNPDFVWIEEEDIQPLDRVWGFGLIGYVAGKFPGKKALLQCCEKWGVQFSYSSHESGWLVFKFKSEEDRDSVLNCNTP